jgi:hypothetical protein
MRSPGVPGRERELNAGQGQGSRRRRVDSTLWMWAALKARSTLGALSPTPSISRFTN